MLITLEGPDGSGKTTQADLLLKWAQSNGIETVKVQDPGYTPLGKELREILLYRTDLEIDHAARAAIFAAARRQLWAEVVKPALAQEKLVITERWHLSTLAYQGVLGGVGLNAVNDLLKAVVGEDTTPHITIYLKVLATEALQRKADKDRFQFDTLEEREKLNNAYDHVAAAGLISRVQVIEPGLSVQGAHERIKDLVKLSPFFFKWA